MQVFITLFSHLAADTTRHLKLYDSVKMEIFKSHMLFFSINDSYWPFIPFFSQGHSVKLCPVSNSFHPCA